MGLDLRSASTNVPINFTKEEINEHVDKFKSLDCDNKGFITINDLRKHFKVSSLLPFSNQYCELTHMNCEVFLNLQFYPAVSIHDTIIVKLKFFTVLYSYS